MPLWPKRWVFLRALACSVFDYQVIVERFLDAGLGIEKYFSYIVIKSPIEGRYPPIERILECE